MNFTAEKLTGWKEEDSIGMKLEEVFPISGLKTDVSDEINLKDIVNGKILLKSKKNVKTQIEGTLTPIKDENGNNDSIINYIPKYVDLDIIITY